MRSPLRTSQVADFAVYASNSVLLMDRVVVNGGDVGVQLAGSGPFLEAGYPLGLRAAHASSSRTTSWRIACS